MRLSTSMSACGWRCAPCREASELAASKNRRQVSLKFLLALPVTHQCVFNSSPHSSNFLGWVMAPALETQTYQLFRVSQDGCHSHLLLNDSLAQIPHAPQDPARGRGITSQSSSPGAPLRSLDLANTSSTNPLLPITTPSVK